VLLGGHRDCTELPPSFYSELLMLGPFVVEKTIRILGLGYRLRSRHAVDRRVVTA